MRERRRHVVYLTRNSEYHCRFSDCVAVRDRVTGQWDRHHWAVRSHLIGAVIEGKRRLTSRPQPGARLLFEGRRPVLTSRLEMVGRPDKSATFAYCSQAWGGTIG